MSHFRYEFPAQLVGSGLNPVEKRSDSELRESFSWVSLEAREPSDSALMPT